MPSAVNPPSGREDSAESICRAASAEASPQEASCQSCSHAAQAACPASYRAASASNLATPSSHLATPKPQLAALQHAAAPASTPHLAAPASQSARPALSRRAFIAVGAAALGSSALALAGCDTRTELEKFEAGDIDTIQGYASDAEVKSYPVELRIYADSNLQWMRDQSTGLQSITGVLPADQTMSKLEGYTLRYQSQAYRNQVTFDIAWTDPIVLEELAQTGFGSADGIVAPGYIVSAGCEAGTVEGGDGEWKVRDLGYNLDTDLVMVRAEGTENDLPPARTLDGEPTSDDGINKVQELPSYDGLLAVADPYAATEGRAANANCLYRNGFYTSDDGRSGEYTSDVADKIRIYASQDEAIAAVLSDECQLGFVWRQHINTRFQGIEELENVNTHATTGFKGSSVDDAAYPGVVRDFFTFISMCSD